MKAKMTVTTDARSRLLDVVADEERGNAGAWWIDLGAEGESCG